MVLQSESFTDDQESESEMEDKINKITQHEDVLGQIAKSRNIALTKNNNPSKASYVTIDGDSMGLNPLVVIPLEPSGHIVGQASF